MKRFFYLLVACLFMMTGATWAQENNSKEETRAERKAAKQKAKEAEKAAEEAVWHIWSQFDHIRKAPPSVFGKGALSAKWSWRVKDRGLTGGRFLLQ